jgi:hypothetical protein
MSNAGIAKDGVWWSVEKEEQTPSKPSKCVEFPYEP